ncbi:hypothetical protein [Rhodococcus sp. MEB041]|uniref:hypothetical protein n=1 Tax=Rhodococcus sp. MEB041 TaxID=3040323 RepID=UPI002549E604|nr:hypothetical protein [Rhodococcus sp. MEB041]
MTVLADFVETRARFARSANIERDYGSGATAGYMPTGRAIDVVARIARGLSNPASGRTFSITGPHGGGKSSLAVFLDGLLSPSRTEEFEQAHTTLRSADAEVHRLLEAGVSAIGDAGEGFVRAFATARAEPVSATIARALHSGAVRSFGADQTVVPNYFSAVSTETPSPEEVRSAVVNLCAIRPVILVVDEFGKNLEAYAASGGSGDPFLLQELAEATQGTRALPLIVLTMQHLAFDEYVQETSSTRRREWAKVQGRFQDIPYVETPAQSRQLVSACFQQKSAQFATAASKWVDKNRIVIDGLGLRDLSAEAAAAFPLHPLALAVLPDLCTRYGQNERTLFSFVAGSEPLAVPRFLESQEWKPSSTIPLLGLGRIYDYFLDSASNMVGVSEGASRWMEIETRIRDTSGLNELELEAVKSIGLLNLISSGGAIRASKSLLAFALITGRPGAKTLGDVQKVLNRLEEHGLIVYRDFSDEYRIWQGSDYNLRYSIERGKRECADKSLSDLLNAATPLEPAVAGRHSQRTGILRIFERRFADAELLADENLGPEWDGVVRYCTETGVNGTTERADGRPIINVVPINVNNIRAAAIESAGLQVALKNAETENADWVAQRELSERTAAATQALRTEVERTWDSSAAWVQVGGTQTLEPRTGLSSMLSAVADNVYSGSPRVANEMIARRELTSQGAKARRVLIEAMLQNAGVETFGLTGYGPERAIYEALFRSTGIHRVATPDNDWQIQAPYSGPWRKAWLTAEEVLAAPATQRRSLTSVFDLLKAPPIGLKDGVIPIFVLTLLIKHADQVALYEHGSLVLALDDAIAERLTRNPNHFTFKYSNTRSGSRRIVLDALSERLKIKGGTAGPTFLNVATALYRELRLLPPYAQKTKRNLSQQAIEVRNAFKLASEPDVLVFESLPRIFDVELDVGTATQNHVAAQKYADHLADVILELRAIYSRLLDEVEEHLALATATNGSLTEVRHRLTGQATNLDGRVLEPKLRAFIGALARPLDDQRWLENVAMVVSEGHAPRVWTDDIAFRFPLAVAEVGGSMRRTQALLYERIASTGELDGYATSRLTITKADGSETTEIVSITARESSAVDEFLDPLLEQLTQLWGSRTTACRMLMARLVVGDDREVAPENVAPDRKDVQHG